MLILQEVLSITIPFAYKNKERHNINGVRLECDNNHLSAIATNGKILIKIDTDFENANNLPMGKYTIDLQDVKKLEKLLKINVNYQISQSLKIIESELLVPNFSDYEKKIPLYSTNINTNKNSSFTPSGICFNSYHIKIIGEAAKKIQDIKSNAELQVYFSNTKDCISRPVLFEMKSIDFNVKMVVMPKQI